MSPIAAIRQEYKQRSLSEQEVAADPILQFTTWWQEAVSAEISEVNAMTLATASAEGEPTARIVLLKGYDKDGFRFFTNYESAKGQQLAENPRACLVFFWKELERQVRIVGTVEKTPEFESDEYYNSRPEGSRIGAWVSPQSRVIENREWLQKKEAEQLEAFKEKPLVRPRNWGGYIVKPLKVEFWQGRPSRLHDRLQYTKLQNGSWKIERLAP